MKFSRLIKESRLFWPDEIAISDGVGKKAFPNLCEVWSASEEHQNEINDWHNIMSWAIFCGFDERARDKIKSDDLSPVKFSEIDLMYVESVFNHNLNVVYPSWPKQMRSQYVNDINS